MVSTHVFTTDVYYNWLSCCCCFFFLFFFSIFMFIFLSGLFLCLCLNYIMIINLFFQVFGACVWLLFVYLYLFVYLRSLFLGFYHCVSIVISFDFISLVIYKNVFQCRIDVYLGQQITLKILAWMAKNLKALKDNISLTKALISIGFSPLS